MATFQYIGRNTEVEVNQVSLVPPSFLTLLCQQNHNTQGAVIDIRREHKLDDYSKPKWQLVCKSSHHLIS